MYGYHSTCSVLKVNYNSDFGEEDEYILRFCKRFKLGVFYGDVAKQTNRLIKKLRREAQRQRKRADILLIYDVGGAGEGVVEMFEEQPELSRIDCWSAFIHGGLATTYPENYRVHIPKAALMSMLISVFEQKRIILSAQSPEIQDMVDELQNLEIKVTEGGEDTFAGRQGKHDDLALSLSLAL